MANPSSMLVPGDFEVDSAAIARKRKLAQILAEQSGQTLQGQMVSGHYVAPAWTEHLASLAGTYMAKDSDKKLDTEEAELNTRYQEGLGGAVEDYLTTRNGGTVEAPRQGPTQAGPALTGSTTHEIQGDPRRAVTEAIASQYKPLQQLGMAELGQLGKSEGVSRKDIMGLSGYTSRSKVAAALSGNLSELVPSSKTHVVNGKLVRENEENNTPVQIGDYSEKFGDLQNVGYDAQGRPIKGQRAQGSGEIKYAPSGGTVVNVDTKGGGAKKFAETIGEGSAKAIMEGAETARKAQANVEVFSNAASVVDQVKGGFGAEGILAVKKLAQQLGAPIDESVTSTEQVVAALGTAVLENSKALGSGSGFSNTDRDFLEKIVLGKIALDHTSLRRAVNIGLASSLNTLRAHEKRMKAALKQDGADPQALEQFKVAVPSYNLDFEQNFGYDAATDRITVRTGEGKGAHPIRGRAVPTAPNTAPKPTGGYTDAMEQRRQQLIRQLGAGK